MTRIVSILLMFGMIFCMTACRQNDAASTALMGSDDAAAKENLSRNGEELSSRSVEENVEDRKGKRTRNKTIRKGI